MKENIRVLLVYERKNRELETAVLLRDKLNNAGFDCKITQFYWGFDFNFFGASPDILIVPHLYNDSSVARVIARYGRPRIIINLQYEQVLSEKWEKLGHHNPSGEARNALHVCWGKATYSRLNSCKVPKGNLLLIGAPHLDLLRSVNEEIAYRKKLVLSREFGLDCNSDWVLFLSSFTYADISEHRLKMNEDVSGSKLEDFVGIHTKSRDELINWFEDAVSQNASKTFIYRPHPDELSLDKVLSLANRFDNFRIIPFGSAKQWIIASDLIVSWYSTTVVESHYLNKPYRILRPFSLPDYFDSVLLKKAEFIENKQEFLEFLGESEVSGELPIELSDIKEYYDNIEGYSSSDSLVSHIESLVSKKVCQEFSVSPKKLFRAKFISFSVFCLFSIYRLSKKNSLFGALRSIKFFDRWFSEFDNQFFERSDISNISDSIKLFSGAPQEKI